MMLARQPFHFLDYTLGGTAALGLRYLLFAGIAWLLGYVLFKRQWFHRKIVAKFPKSSEVWREIGYSALSMLIFGLVGAATFYAYRQGWTQMYGKVGKYGMVWFWASIGCAIVIHDAWFYWTHRLMHHRRLFRWFHRVHHLSHNPTPWAAYAFSPLEALVQALIFPLLTVIMPIHGLAFGLFMMWQISFNIVGHMGYEFHPRWLMQSPLRYIINTPTNHIMHHEKMRGNYGLYFNWWDRLMGTNHEEYERRFSEVTTREKVLVKK
ncbi:sterol desaturase/sphingolipid hydroxylase (fatty acid hydroxylase superfamily) [Prosthecobacter fusiformis]|uniref:Sterol desaturase/sphingolipid hydroxylase (Fatty acid hydroxylase superfamily) n=1 Tax=Prosthecobacter fusiformis TaxID=48464 RepID=A0A4R7RZI7_9BACT|nr:sterol desaturase family protein [Prosthecobacter fusiformis]TDU71352.1 sterol desaturase/sphingolipid hydroxylase (fatty acid hydroxylase superfamily) [Prosthecobacter fusiformis]